MHKKNLRHKDKLKPCNPFNPVVFCGKNIGIFCIKISIWGKYINIFTNTGVFGANTVVPGSHTMVFGGNYSGILGRNQRYLGQILLYFAQISVI